MGPTPAMLAMLLRAARNQPNQPSPPSGGAPQLNAALFPSIFPQATPTVPDTASPSGALPPSSPFPAASSGVDPSLLNQASKVGMQETGTQLERARAAGNASMPAIAAEANIPIPKMGWLDTQGQPPQPGAGHAILRALTALAASTRPGQAIEAAQYGPGLRRYAMEKSSRAKQIEELQKQQQLEQGALPATSGMIYHPMMAASSQERADAAMMRAKAYQDYTQKIIPLKEGLMQIAQGNLNEKMRHDKVAEFLTGQGIEVQRDRNGVILSIGMNGQQLKADEFNAAVANKNQGLVEQILQSLGVKAFQGVPSPTGTTEVQPVTAGQQQPFQRPPSTAPGRASQINTIRNKAKGAPGSSPDNPIIIK